MIDQKHVINKERLFIIAAMADVMWTEDMCTKHEEDDAMRDLHFWLCDYMKENGIEGEYTNGYFFETIVRDNKNSIRIIYDLLNLEKVKLMKEKEKSK